MKERIFEHYIHRIRDDETPYAVLDWESAEAQGLRFRAMTDRVPLEGRSLLDVGCGLGDLYCMLKEMGIHTDYLGIDIIPEMIVAAKKHQPGASFQELDLFRNPDALDHTFDVVFCSGIFNLNLGNNRQFLIEALEVFFGLANDTVVFNLLHKRSPDPDAHYFYFTPEEVIPLVKPYTDDIEIVDDYLANDFTVIAHLHRTIRA
jgi:SAM-dependent methyltransferase